MSRNFIALHLGERFEELDRFLFEDQDEFSEEGVLGVTQKFQVVIARSLGLKPFVVRYVDLIIDEVRRLEILDEVADGFIFAIDVEE